MLTEKYIIVVFVHICHWRSKACICFVVYLFMMCTCGKCDSIIGEGATLLKCRPVFWQFDHGDTFKYSPPSFIYFHTIIIISNKYYNITQSFPNKWNFLQRDFESIVWEYWILRKKHDRNKTYRPGILHISFWTTQYMIKFLKSLHFEKCFTRSLWVVIVEYSELFKRQWALSARQRIIWYLRQQHARVLNLN